MKTQALLEVKNLKTAFTMKGETFLAVNDVSLSLNAGEILGLVGESGSGKSVTGFSLMKLIDKPGKIIGGEILFKGENLCDLSEKKMRHLRGNRIAMIFQDPMMTLNPVLTIETQMIETIKAHEKVSYKAAWKSVRDMLELMGVSSPEARLKAYPHQLSGGMRQRVAIAISLLLKPELIIADEPTTALDVTIQAQILSEVQKLSKNFGTALIWITHDLSVIAGLADKVAVMYAGKIVEAGAIDQVLTDPKHPYTKGLIESLPSHNQRGARLRQIEGITPNLSDLPKGCAFSTRCIRLQPECQEMPLLRTLKENHQVRCFFPNQEAILNRELS